MDHLHGNRRCLGGLLLSACKQRCIAVILVVISAQACCTLVSVDESIDPSASKNISETCSSGLDVKGNEFGASDDYVVADKYQQLRQWVHNASGYEPLVKVDKICYGSGDESACLRGLVAVRDIKANELVAKLPLGYYITVPQATGVSLLEKIYQEPDFNTTFATWLAVLPDRREIMTPENMSDEEIAIVQGGALGDRFEYLRKILRDGFEADSKNSTSVVAKNKIGWEEYAHAYMTLATRYWAFVEEHPAPDGNGTVSISVATMIPFMDMANHDDNNNAYVTKSGDLAVTYASKDIPQGAEMKIVYQSSQLHRSDAAMQHYGYFPKQVPPLLAAYDLGGESGQQTRASGTIFPTPMNDDDYKLGGPMCHSAELARLVGILTGFPTSEAEDRFLLQSGNWTDRERVLLEMRIDRKAALGFVIARMTDGIKEWNIMSHRTKARWDYSNFNSSSIYDDNSTYAPSDTASDSLHMDWTMAKALIAQYEESQKTAAA